MSLHHFQMTWTDDKVQHTFQCSGAERGGGQGWVKGHTSFSPTVCRTFKTLFPNTRSTSLWWLHCHQVGGTAKVRPELHQSHTTEIFLPQPEMTEDAQISEWTRTNLGLPTCYVFQLLSCWMQMINQGNMGNIRYNLASKYQFLCMEIDRSVIINNLLTRESKISSFYLPCKINKSVLVAVQTEGDSDMSVVTHYLIISFSLGCGLDIIPWPSSCNYSSFT